MTTLTTTADRYLDLLMEAVNGSIYGDQPYLRRVDARSNIRRAATRAVSLAGVILAVEEQVQASAFEDGRDWPQGRLNPGESMIGRARLRNVRMAAETVLEQGVQGDFIETGVWRGGACILMRGVLAAHGVSDRKVYVADSFQGLPPADSEDDAAGLHEDMTLAISQQQVRDAFSRYNLLDGQVEFVEGWFADSLPGLRGTIWSLIRLDGDMYGSTMDGISNLYPDLSPGGYVIIDDYLRYKSCRRAIDEYRHAHGINEGVVSIDEDGVFWRKSDPSRS